MTRFLIDHIDAVITTALGLYFTVYSFRKRDSLKGNSNGLVKLLPVLSPIVLIFGLIQFTFTTEAVHDWQQVNTDDMIASVDFPFMPTRNEATDHLDGISVHRTSHVANLAKGQLNLRLSYNQHPPGSDELSDEEIFTGIRESFARQGFTIIEDEYLPDKIRVMVVEMPEKKARISARIRLMPNGIYRAMATSLSGLHDDPVIDQFLSSFAINSKQDGDSEKQ